MSLTLGQTGKDRRQFPRLSDERPCRIFDPIARRFAPALTKNVSRGGALLTIQWGRHLFVGDPIDVIIASPPLAPAHTMIKAHVVRRIAGAGEVQVVAVEFEEPLQALAA
jgi:hypothetical protein